mgnify:CR=1 FL=1
MQINRRVPLVIGWMVLVASVPACAPAASPAETGSSTVATLDRLVPELMASLHVPGVSLL